MEFSGVLLDKYPIEAVNNAKNSLWVSWEAVIEIVYWTSHHLASIRRELIGH